MGINYEMKRDEAIKWTEDMIRSYKERDSLYSEYDKKRNEYNTAKNKAKDMETEIKSKVPLRNAAIISVITLIISVNIWNPFIGIVIAIICFAISYYVLKKRALEVEGEVLKAEADHFRNTVVKECEKAMNNAEKAYNEYKKNMGDISSVYEMFGSKRDIDTQKKLERLLNILKSGRAETLKEALNCYQQDIVNEKHLAEMEKQTQELQKQSEEIDKIKKDVNTTKWLNVSQAIDTDIIRRNTSKK